MKYRTLIKYFVIVLVVTILAVCPKYASANGTDQEITEEKNVLYISSYSPAVFTFDEQLEGIRSRFADNDMIKLDAEFMDTKNFNTQENIDNFFNSIKYKLDNGKYYDAIIVGDDNGLVYLMEIKDDLFYNIPIFFLGINDVDLAVESHKDPFVTGVVEEKSFKKTIDMAKMLNPNVENVVSIIDNSPSSIAEYDLISKLDYLYPEFEFIFIDLSTMSFEEFFNSLEVVEENDIVFYLSALKDVNGDISTYDDMHQKLDELLDAPIYSIGTDGVGNGLLGGCVVSHVEQGYAAADMVMQYFNGTDVEDIPFSTKSPNRYMVDYQEFKEHGFKFDDLPEGTMIINRTYTFWEKNWKALMVGLIIIIVETVIIYFLFNSIRKRRKTEKELKKQKNKQNDILSLTARIGLRDERTDDFQSFLSDMLKTSIDVVDEADSGVAYIYKNDNFIITDVVGHDKRLCGITVNTFLPKTGIRNIVRLKDGKKNMLNQVSGEKRAHIEKYMNVSSETLIMILSYNDERIAGLALEKEKGCFSNESLNLVNTLRNIPMAFFSQSTFYKEQNMMFENILESIIKILSLHNEYTEEHSINVAMISFAIAQKLGLNKNEVDLVYWTGLVHDIGKILIPEVVLDKTGKLTAKEWEMIKMHPVWGYETLIQNRNLKEIARYVLHHHERWDGSGYPSGIAGEDIPLVSRILMVADTYDAMTNDRPYRKALGKSVAVKEIIDNAGTQFDPEIARIFVDNIDSILKSASKR